MGSESDPLFDRIEHLISKSHYADALLLAERSLGRNRARPTVGDSLREQGREEFTIGRLRAALTADTAIIGWIDTDPGIVPSRAWGYVVRRSGPVMWAEIPVAPETATSAGSPERAQLLREKLLRAGSSPTGAPPYADDIPASLALWTERMKPLADGLAGADRLIVIPSRATAPLPVEAWIRPDGLFLGEAFSVSYAQSLAKVVGQSDTARLRSSITLAPALLVGDPPFTPADLNAMLAATSTIAPVADRMPPHERSADAKRGIPANETGLTTSLPRLAHSRREIHDVATLFPNAWVLLGPDASESMLTALVTGGEMRTFRTIHFATHTLIDDTRPERSAIVLSQVDHSRHSAATPRHHAIRDGLVTAQDVMRDWKLDADLVTLSGCETARGTSVTGDGFLGLADAFLLAGARSIVVSLWNVNDEATALLMRRFYENWTGSYSDPRGGRLEPMTKVDALREAKCWLRRYEDETGTRIYSHQYFWAPFVLICAAS